MSYYQNYEGGYEQEPVQNGKENTGRWTAEEHRLFLQGLELHGKGWKKIASLIRTRTVVQIRTHAQKYFQKLAKARLTIGGGDGEGFFLGRKKRKKLYNANLTSNITRMISSKTSTFPPSSRPLTILHPKSHVAPYVSAPSQKLLNSNRNIVKRVLSDSIGKYLTPVAFEGADGNAPVEAGEEDSLGVEPIGGGSHDPEKPPICYPFGAEGAVGAPKWFREGLDVGHLVHAGVDLDWSADPGSSYVQPAAVSTVIFPNVGDGDLLQGKGKEGKVEGSEGLEGAGIIRAHSEVWNHEVGYEQELVKALINEQEDEKEDENENGGGDKLS